MSTRAVSVMATKRRARAALTLATTLTLAACTVGPDFQRPAKPTVESFISTPAAGAAADASPSASMPRQRLAPGTDVPALWWALFHCEALNRLVERALSHGHDVAAAQAALRAAREQVLAQQGVGWPQADLSLASSRQLVSNTLSSPLSTNSYSFNLHTAQLDVSYVPDVFGGNRRLVESLQAEAEAQLFQLRATQLTLASNVVLAVLQHASLQAQSDVASELLRLQQEQLTLIRQQVTAGQASIVDIAAQQTALAQTAALLPTLRKQASQQRTLLAALLGDVSEASIGAPIPLAQIELPAELPLSLPSSLVDQRPDIRAAEAQLHAASAQVGVAMADRLPSITLGLQGGSSSGALSSLFARGNGFAAAGLSITEPLLRGGSLLHRQRAAEATLDQARAQYRGVVSTAFQNVADALHAIDIDGDGLVLARDLVSAAGSAFVAAQRRLAAGDVSRLDLISATQAVQLAKMNLVQAEASRLEDAVALMQALGGGWWGDAQ